jgi:ribosomal protein L22
MSESDDKRDEVEETPVPETPAEPVDQQERADEEAARAAAAAEEAAEAAEDAPTPVAEAAAAEAEELAEVAEEAAEAAADAPKPKRARKAREAEQAADQAEVAADEAKESARRSRVRRGGRKAEEPKAVPVGLTVSAKAKYVRTSARKARLVCDHIRGKDVTEARAILAFTTRGAAEAWSKLLESAVANAEHNHELVGEDLKIFNVHADEGPTLKRYRPRAMGRATRIRKRTSHLSITLTPKES